MPPMRIWIKSTNILSTKIKEKKRKFYQNNGSTLPDIWNDNNSNKYIKKALIE